MLNEEVVLKKVEEAANKPIKECVGLSAIEPLAGFERLIGLRDSVDAEVYAYYFRCLMQCDTDGVSVETIMSAYEGLTFKDIMYPEEYAEWEKLPDMITIYRGTPATEFPPRVSWSLKEEVARRYSQGQMYKAVIHKTDIMGLFTSNTDEFEVLDKVKDGEFDDIF